MIETQSGAAATRQAIISAALRLFGEYGYNAVSTRKIAELSEANIGSIAYHFGGKPGLMRACALYVIEIAENNIGSAMLEPISDRMTPAEAREELIELLLRLVRPMTPNYDEDEVSAFIMRYISLPSEAFDLLFTRFIQPLHNHLRQLLARATGQDEGSEDVAILTFTLLGQSQYFKICRHIVQRSLDWDGIGMDECAKLRKAVSLNVNAIVDAYTTPAVRRSHIHQLAV
ncbi:CerR family C-terminal domain-containing protein [Martelella soudanensis]|uniref:CerR family C-terminal domain-containing protein n=1 Tax=unclassified Martelella TaxID=2629616 RepID=UPI0015DF4209|nr:MULTISPECIES: CerR family C-terminal domain-containing protein [unclassified Martelella]